MSFIFSFLLSTVMVSGSGSAPESVDKVPNEEISQTAENAGIGIVVELQGTAHASLNGKQRELQEGNSVYTAETLYTGESSSLQIELNDESLFTLSSETSIVLDEFVYSENSSQVKSAATVTKGIFRYISGKIAQQKPENISIEIPSGTIGIRGTIVIGEIEGEKCLVSLETEEGDTAQHRVIVSGRPEAGGKIQEIEITKPGFATMIESRGQAPRPAFQLPNEQRNKFQERLPQRPQFTPGTKPGDPQRYPSMRPGAQKEMREGMRSGNLKDPQSFEGQNRPGREGENKNQRFAGEPNENKFIQGEKEDQKPFQGPNGPDGPGDQRSRMNGQKPENFNHSPKGFENNQLDRMERRENFFSGPGNQKAPFEKRPAFNTPQPNQKGPQAGGQGQPQNRTAPAGPPPPKKQ